TTCLKRNPFSPSSPMARATAMGPGKSGTWLTRMARSQARTSTARPPREGARERRDARRRLSRIPGDSRTASLAGGHRRLAARDPLAKPALKAVETDEREHRSGEDGDRGRRILDASREDRRDGAAHPLRRIGGAERFQEHGIVEVVDERAEPFEKLIRRSFVSREVFAVDPAVARQRPI